MHDTTMAVIKAAEEEFGIKINAVSEETEAYKVKCNAAASGGTLPRYLPNLGSQCHRSIY